MNLESIIGEDVLAELKSKTEMLSAKTEENHMLKNKFLADSKYLIDNICHYNDIFRDIYRLVHMIKFGKTIHKNLDLPNSNVSISFYAYDSEDVRIMFFCGNNRTDSYDEKIRSFIVESYNEIIDMLNCCVKIFVSNIISKIDSSIEEEDELTSEIQTMLESLHKVNICPHCGLPI